MITRLTRAEGRVVELEKDFKEHERIFKGEIEKVEEEKEGLEAQLKRLEEENCGLVEKHIEKTNAVVEESKASAVRAVLQARIEMAREDPFG